MDPDGPITKTFASYKRALRNANERHRHLKLALKSAIEKNYTLRGQLETKERENDRLSKRIDQLAERIEQLEHEVLYFNAQRCMLLTDERLGNSDASSRASDRSYASASPLDILSTGDGSNSDLHNELTEDWLVK